jgi:hypothetical protein
LNKEETYNLKRPIMSNVIKAVAKSFPTNKNPGPEGFTVEFS